ncbi:hypothetical protein JJB07_14735 [Tumebacillus sp. ITR2]|uniref:Uncharacterized protein n=1 Tax=Tumebacillus amylolyticus TaxID=2801339 RepID=A0ABS1JC90_9BACL|nr:hypothetical protein [Tumebacillus amylolyticus]MBL0387895.1 hypothetical protein [Tumebacillus amylolyticus]
MAIRYDGEFKGYVGLSDKEVERLVKSLLKDYKKLEGRIKAATRQAEGKGMTIARGAILTGYEERLAEVGRAYTQDNHELMHVAKAENLFAGIQGCTEEDTVALDEITGLMVGTRAFGGEAVVWNGLVVPFDVACDLAAQDARNFQQEKDTIDYALEELEKYDPNGALILRGQYCQRRSVANVMMELQELITAEDTDATLAESTYHRWRKEAVKEFGKLVGVC